MRIDNWRSIKYFAKIFFAINMTFAAFTLKAEDRGAAASVPQIVQSAKSIPTEVQNDKRGMVKAGGDIGLLAKPSSNQAATGTSDVTVAQVISIVKDVILCLAAVVGAYVALMGLGAWQRQLKGQSDHDLSRRILVSSFKYRNALLDVRNPAMWNYEMPSPPDEDAGRMTERQIRHYGIAQAYSSRWEKVNNEKAILYADLLEAEALWGNDLDDLFKDIFKLENELSTDSRLYLQILDPSTSDASVDAIQRIRDERREVIYDDLSDEGDAYKKEFRAAIDRVVVYLKPKLVRK